MQKDPFPSYINLVLALLTALAVVIVLTGPPMSAQVKKVPVSPTAKDSGPEMYKAYCASCHGLDGKGKGPAAAALKVPATDLTILSKSNGGKFPELKFQNVLRVNTNLAAHGTSDMPTWGPIFRNLESGSEGFVSMRVFNLMKYVESIQEK
jgi:mono/diheme cytochrome c family protein